jgi:diguanylate cyclase (GGDEF)-like protein
MQCVVFIDLDGFKDVNDNYGHDVGDALIRHIASALQTRVPAGPCWRGWAGMSSPWR